MVSGTRRRGSPRPSAGDGVNARSDYLRQNSGQQDQDGGADATNVAGMFQTVYNSLSEDLPTAQRKAICLQLAEADAEGAEQHAQEEVTKKMLLYASEVKEFSKKLGLNDDQHKQVSGVVAEALLNRHWLGSENSPILKRKQKIINSAVSTATSQELPDEENQQVAEGQSWRHAHRRLDDQNDDVEDEARDSFEPHQELRRAAHVFNEQLNKEEPTGSISDVVNAYDEYDHEMSKAVESANPVPEAFETPQVLDGTTSTAATTTTSTGSNTRQHDHPRPIHARSRFGPGMHLRPVEGTVVAPKQPQVKIVKGSRICPVPRCQCQKKYQTYTAVLDHLKENRCAYQEVPLEISNDVGTCPAQRLGCPCHENGGYCQGGQGEPSIKEHLEQHGFTVVVRLKRKLPAPRAERQRIREQLPQTQAEEPQLPTSAPVVDEPATKKKTLNVNDMTIEECRNAITEKLQRNVGENEFYVYDALGDNDMQEFAKQLKTKLGRSKAPGIFVQIDKSGTNRHKVIVYNRSDDKPFKEYTPCSKFRNKNNSCRGCQNHITQVLIMSGFTELK